MRDVRYIERFEENRLTRRTAPARTAAADDSDIKGFALRASHAAGCGKSRSPRATETSSVARKNFLFTSESVSEGHPDKVCDRISDEIVDLYFREGVKAGIDPYQIRVACETLATTNRVIIAGETRGPDLSHAVIEQVARDRKSVV